MKSIPNDWPLLSGNLTEWPNFITQYKTTTEICGFSSYENQITLQRCLKSKAKDAVQTLLILPEHVNKVINTLDRRFVRE